MTPVRRNAVVAGALYFVTHVTSVAAVLLYNPVLGDKNYVLGAGQDNEVLLGGLLEVILALAVVGTGAALYPIVKTWSPAGAFAYAALRTLEAATILAGVCAILGVVTLRQNAAGLDRQSLTTVTRALVAVHDWTFLIGPGLVVGVHTTLLAWLLLRARLVARFVPVLGLVGGPAVFLANLGIMFGLWARVSAIPAPAAVIAFAWEISLALYLIVKGPRLPAPSAAG